MAQPNIKNAPRTNNNYWLNRVALGLAGAAVLIYAFISVRFRDAEGYLLPVASLILSAGVALVVMAIFSTTRLRRFGGWFALAVIGQAAALQLTEAGKIVRYQHYYPPSELVSGVNLVFLVILVVQALLVIIGIKRYGKEIRNWVAANFKTWQIILIAGVFVLTSAALSRDIWHYGFELLFASFIQLVNLGNLLLMIAAIPRDVLDKVGKKIGHWLDEGDNIRESVSVIPWLGAIWVFGLSGFLSFFVYQRHPHIQDEAMYLFHARYLAQGQLGVPAPEVPEAFSLYLIPDNASRWYSIFPPGWPAFLSIGVVLGAPWLINSLLAGINVLLIAKFLQEIYNRQVALLAVLLLMLSPWYIFLGMSFMAHMATLSCGLIAALSLLQARKHGKLIWALLAGIMVGVTTLIRLQDGFILGLLLGLWALGLGGRRLSPKNLTAFVGAALVVAGLNFVYNHRLMGSPTVFPLNAYYDEYFGPKTNAYGFGPERGLDWPLDAFPGHSPLEAVLNASLNAFSTNVELFGWGMGSLLLASLYILTNRQSGSDYWMLAVIVTVVGVLSLYWFNGGPDFGARYWFLILVPLLALTVRGILSLEDRLGTTVPNIVGRPVITAVLCLSLISLINFFPWRSLDKYFHYLGMRPDVRTLTQINDSGKSLVLVKGKQFLDYQSAWVYNPLDPQADAPIYAWDKSPEVRSRLLQAYADRPVWIVEGPTLTLRGYEVIEGPVPAIELLTGSVESP